MEGKMSLMSSKVAKYKIASLFLIGILLAIGGCDTGTNSYTFDITVSSGSGGSVSVANPAITLEAGQSQVLQSLTASTTLSLTATPAAGYTFTGWSFSSGAASSTTNPLDYIVTDHDETITAGFAVSRTVEISLSASTAAPGDTVTVSLTPDFDVTSPMELIVHLPVTNAARNLAKGVDYTVTGLGSNNEITLAAGSTGTTFTLTIEEDVISDGKTIMVGLLSGLDYTAGPLQVLTVNSATHKWTDVTLAVGSSLSWIAAARADDTTTTGIDESALLIASGQASYTTPVDNAYDTWTEPTGGAALPANAAWSGIDVLVNANGSAQLAACADGDYIYHLPDSANSPTWLQMNNGSITNTTWKDVAFFGEGRIAAVYGQGVRVTRSTAFSNDPALWFLRSYLAGTDYSVVAGANASLYTAAKLHLAGLYNNSGSLENRPTHVSIDFTNQSMPVLVDGQSTVLPANPAGEINDITGSPDGTKVAIAAGTSAAADYIYLSSDSGANFTRNTAAGQRAWGAVAMSSDGQTIYAIAEGDAATDGLYTSNNGGTGWTLMDGLDVDGSDWMLRCSPDGTILVAAQNGGYLYVSTDLGLSWTERQ